MLIAAAVLFAVWKSGAFGADRFGAAASDACAVFDGSGRQVCIVRDETVFTRALEDAAEDIISRYGVYPDFTSWHCEVCRVDPDEAKRLTDLAGCTALIMGSFDIDGVNACELLADGVSVAYCTSENAIYSALDTVLAEENDFVEECFGSIGHITVQFADECVVQPCVVPKEKLTDAEALTDYLRSVKESDYVWLGEYKNACDAESEKMSELEKVDRMVFLERGDGEDFSESDSESVLAAKERGYDPNSHEWAKCTLPADRALIHFRYVCREVRINQIEYETVYEYTQDRVQGFSLDKVTGANGSALCTETSVYSAGKLVDAQTVVGKVVEEKVDRVVLVGQRDPGKPGIGTGRFMWPVIYTDKPQITSYYGGRRSQYDANGYHLGIDIYLLEGTEVYSSDSGVVSLSGENDTYGNYIIIDHADGFQTVYAHLSQRLVEEGEAVCGGVLIGLSGMTGSVSGPHLHFEVRSNFHTMNPIRFLPSIEDEEEPESDEEAEIETEE